jgi:hypothetical protein
VDDGPIIHRHSDSFDDRNMVLHLALGLASVNQTLREGLAPTEAPAPIDEARDRAILDFWVGLIHVTDIATDALRQAKDPTPVREDTGTLDGVSDHTERTLLR